MINQSVFIQNLLEEKHLIGYNPVNIPMKTSSFIEISKVSNHKKANLKAYQCLIIKLIYLLCNIKPNIVFVIGQLSKSNTNSRIGYFKVVKRVV